MNHFHVRVTGRDAGERIRSARMAKRLYARDVAAVAGKSAATVYAWEAGSRSVVLDEASLEAVASLLGVTVRWIRTGETEAVAP